MAEIEREDRLEGLGSAAWWRCLIKDLDKAPDDIGPPGHRAACGHPVGRGHAIGIDEHEKRRSGFPYPAIPRRGRALFWLGNKVDSRERIFYVFQRLSRAVVDHKDFARRQII